MTPNNKERIHKLLKGIETGDPAAVSVVNEEKYIQHNPQTQEGSEGLAVLFKRLSKTSPRVNIVRIFEDADFVFAHTEYDFSSRNIGFEIFRFEDGQAVEHWDNIQKRKGPNGSGHTMVDGKTEVADHEKTESNRHVIRTFVEEVLISSNFNHLDDYINQSHYTEHNPSLSDLGKVREFLSNSSSCDSIQVSYEKVHRLLAEGNFVLSVCEGYSDKTPRSFFDLYRLEDGKIVEHWDTTESIPPRKVWKNNNGKF
jgi:predicted SnoaL-like aldol condensation-catalyzing enzyme